MKTIVGLIGFAVTLSGFTQATMAQVVPDGTIPSNVRSLDGLNFTIEDGARSGNNLFHSFGQFSVPTGGAAIFNNPVDVQNIFNRITGGSVSNIDGLVRVNGTANLFLLNPNGILFGPNAQIDLRGSLIATTASAILFGTQGQFSATDTTSYPLLTIQPSALWFNANPQPIQVSGNSPGLRQGPTSFAPGQLQVASENSLVLVGGNINLAGASIGIDQAQVSIVGLADAGQVNLLRTGNYWSAQPDPSSSLANIALTQGAIIRSRQGQESRIFLQGSTITLADQSKLVVSTQDASTAGMIEIQAANLSLKNRSAIRSDSYFGSGTPGKIQINTTQSVEIDQSIASVTMYGTAAVGGELVIDTARLSVLNGGVIGTSTFNSGNAGTVRINASESIKVSGSGIPVAAFVLSTIESAAFSLPVVRQALNTPIEPSGNAGTITINTKQLQIFDQGSINVRNEGTGKGGEIKIVANEIKLERSGFLSAAAKAGEEGNLTIQSQVLLLRDRSQILATATGTGNGGNISVISPLILGLENSDIVASAVQGRGGNIQLTTQGILGFKYRDRLTSENDITASSEFGVNGTVQINNIGVDPASGLLEFPVEIIDPTQQVAQTCATDPGSRFVVTGRGGVPENPSYYLTPDRPWQDLRAIPVKVKGSIAQSAHIPPTRIEATHWRRNTNGSVEILVSNPSSPTPSMMATCAPQ